jgi:hypothetical protein
MAQAKSRKCKFCRTQFEPRRPDQRFCKPACRKLAYEKTEAATARKRKYETSLRGTIAQYKYDHSEAGKTRRKRYNAKPKDVDLLRESVKYFWKSEDLKEYKRIAKRIEKRKALRSATTQAKDAAVRAKILHNVETLGIRPQEACVLMREEWTSRGVNPPWWFTWGYYATQEEINEQRIYEHEQTIQADAQQRGIPYEQAAGEYKDAIIRAATDSALQRAGFMGQMSKASGRSNGTTTEQINMCMADRDANFDYQWAGGKPWSEGGVYERAS